MCIHLILYSRQHTNNCNIVLRGLELPESDINGDTTLTLGLQLVKHPGVLERTLAKLGSFLYCESAWFTPSEATSRTGKAAAGAHGCG